MESKIVLMIKNSNKNGIIPVHDTFPRCEARIYYDSANVVVFMQRSLDIARTLFAENKGKGQWDIYALLLWLTDYRACIRLTGFAAGSEYVWEYVWGYC